MRSFPFGDQDFERAFWARVARSMGNGCWTWQGAVGNHGYGRITWKDTTWLAHRAAYMLVHGPIARGMVVCHACDNRVCVRPGHLWIGTHEANRLDMLKKGRHWTGDRSKVRMPRGQEHWTKRFPQSIARGEMRSTARLTEEKVRALRQAWRSGVSMADLARQYRVSNTCIRFAVIGRTWAHVQD